MGHTHDNMLNTGYGSCILRDERLRKIVVESLEYGAGKDYYISAYVVMPNHVHILFQPTGEKTLDRILHSIKSYTATAINRLTGHTGRLWQRECYDRIVRDEEEYKYYRAYIKNNPVHLPSGHYTLYV